ncbi:hypothetical protein EC991_007219 [Linnemannia zychae]|nr:hypothetical protein EC991_007219 [Linnemannia zychae]
MANNLLTLFCLVDGESTPFPVKIESTETIGSLKDEIKLKNAPEFDDIAADKLTLWRVSIPVPEDDDNQPPILLNNIVTKDKKKLGPATRLSKVFPAELPEETIHFIVQRPPQGREPEPETSQKLPKILDAISVSETRILGTYSLGKNAFDQLCCLFFLVLSSAMHI